MHTVAIPLGAGFEAMISTHDSRVSNDFGSNLTFLHSPKVLQAAPGTILLQTLQLPSVTARSLDAHCLSGENTVSRVCAVLLTSFSVAAIFVGFLLQHSVSVSASPEEASHLKSA
jgi:hypothetical protein